MAGVQFPYPRKFSDPSPYQPARSSTPFRGRRLRNLAVYLVGGFTLLFVLLWLLGGSSRTPALPPGTPEVVIVTTLSPQMSKPYKESIKENRRDYAARHGYATFFPNTTDYDLMPGVPQSWSMVPALRHAMSIWPRARWVFYLSSTALIMNPDYSVHEKILDPRTLESLMIVDKPVVPPDSVIKTFSHLRGERVDFVLTQDWEGLASGSLLVRTGDWAKFLFDSWFDPLYRSYNFQKAERHALEHIVQWHGTVLAKLALVPQRLLNSYTKSTGSTNSDGLYQEGDFVANCHGCEREAGRHCEDEMAPLITRWRELRDQERR